MSDMCLIIGGIALLLQPIALLVLVWQMIHRKPKKKAAIALTVCVGVFVLFETVGVMSMCKHELVLIDEVVPTCTEKGERISRCSICDKTVTDNIQSTGHDFVVLSCVESTIHSEGREEVQCRRCKYVEIRTIEKLACEHKWKEATCTEKRTCTVCGETTGEKEAHDFEVTEQKESTLLSAGKTCLVCSRCGTEVEYELPAKKESEERKISILTSHKARAKKLAELGKEAFVESDFDAYINKLREVGFRDLTAEVDALLYNFEEDYSKKTKTLYLECQLVNIKSDQIDLYFTKEYNGEESAELASVLEKMRKNFAQSYTYELGDIGTVVVQIISPHYEFSVMTSEGRTYEYVYGYADSVRVQIDEDWVFTKDLNPHGGIEDAYKPVLYEVPYDGMPASKISQTELGEPDEIELCKDYYLLVPDRRSVKYTWYDSEGKKLFYAYALAGEVTSIIDYR